ncbi:hypothetical protein CC80DRAFT_541329 [Byssothecium circinans]|uniref:Uncharacterized protein n=1 Tax=Byssothecium circinans TaxID=147558 RepID=A0A6A5UEQ9_9PLEO|nr:hypothetical protein CC80DRAFT_541329 [Byssothecium circinans]
MPPPRLRTLTTTLLYFLTLFILPTTCAPSYLTNPYSTERLPTPTSSHNDPTPFTQWVEYLQHQRWVLLATWLIFIFDALSCAVMLWLWIAGWEQAMERCDGWVGLIFCCLGGRRRRYVFPF